MSQIEKVAAEGGKCGNSWDDGSDHDGVTKIHAAVGWYGIQYIKCDYIKNGTVKEAHFHGLQGCNFEAQPFVINHPDEYLVSIEGWYCPNGIIQGLQFKTNKKTSDLIGYEIGTPFTLQVQDKKIIGLHGFAGYNLRALGAYFAPLANSTEPDNTVPSTPNLQGKWLKMEQKGTAPGLRCSHAIAAIGNKIYSFGGELKPNHPIDKHLYVYDIKTKTWSIAPATGDIPQLACLGVGMVSIGTTLYIFGGRDDSRKYNGFYSFDTIKNEWKLLTPVEKVPTPRSFHSMAADDKNVYVFGGVSATNRIKTLDVYNIVDKKWVQLPTPGDYFKIRGGAGLEVVDGNVWVVYGFTGYELDDIHYFDLSENNWLQVETTGQKPSARSVFASAVIGKYIIVFGGEVQMDPKAHEGPGELSDGTFALDTETLKWERLDKYGEEGPSPRGWAASTTVTIDGKKGLVMLGGKAQNNERFDDLYFYEVESV